MGYATVTPDGLEFVAQLVSRAISLEEVSWEYALQARNVSFKYFEVFQKFAASMESYTKECATASQVGQELAAQVTIYDLKA